MGTVQADAEAWKRIGELVRIRREELGKTQAQLAAESGVGPQTVYRIEKGRPSTRHTSSWSKLERGLHWMPGSFQAALDGGLPVVGSYDGRFLRVQVDNASEFVHDIVRKISIELDPDVSLSRIMRAEAVAEEALREAGLLPPLDQGADGSEVGE